MKITTKLTTLALLFTLPLAITSCGDSDKKASTEIKIPSDAKGVLEASIVHMEKLTDRLASVTDAESAKAAIPDLEKITANIVKLTEKAKSLGLSEKEDKILNENPKLNEKYEISSKKMMGFMMSSKPEVAEILKKTLDPIFSK